MQKIVQKIKEAASNDSLETLILGETGTGKELVANAIHKLSYREGDLVARNITELDSNLIASELFGHVRGAFTGADHDKAGIFEQAEGGTIFLDEIGDLNLENQAKLLRVLQEKEVIRVGSSKRISLNIKVITATRRNLKKLVEDGKFREDLYYRSSRISLNCAGISLNRKTKHRTMKFPWNCPTQNWNGSRLIHGRAISDNSKRSSKQHTQPQK